MTRKEFEGLHVGQILHHIKFKNSDGTPDRWKVNGVMQGSLKTGSARWPLKHGLYSYDYLRLDDLSWLVILQRDDSSTS